MPFEPDKPASRFVPDEQPMSGKAAIADALFRMLPFSASRNFADFNKALEGVAYKAGEKVTDAAAPVVPAEVAAGLGTATNVGIQAVPSLLGMGAGTQAAPLMDKTARSAMNIALKPTASAHKSGAAPRAVQTALDEGVLVTKGGVEKVRGEIDTLNAQIKEIIKNSNSVIDKQGVAKRLDDLMDEVKTRFNAADDQADIKKVIDTLVNHQLLKDIGTMPVQLAQQFKQSIYKSNRKAYAANATKSDATVEAETAVARALKEDIAKAHPDVGVANARESKLLNLEEILKRRVGMAGNNNVSGLGILGADATPAGIARYLWWMGDRSPAVMSALAQGLHAGRTAVPQTAGALSGLLASGYLGKRD